jgi:hypothetical protein
MVIKKHTMNVPYFYTYLVPSDKHRSLLSEYDRKDIINSEKFIVCYSPSSNIHKYAIFDNVNHFIKYMRSLSIHERYFHEIILGEQLQKPRFDIDIKKKDGDDILQLDPDNDSCYRYGNYELIGDYKITNIMDIILHEIVDSILDTLFKLIPELQLNKDVLVYTSHDYQKNIRSLHLIINNYFLDNNEQCKALYNIVNSNLPKLYRDKQYIDHNIYKSIQSFRIITNIKGDSNRVKTFNDEYLYKGKKFAYCDDNEIPIELMEYQDIYSSLITTITNCDAFPLEGLKIIESHTMTNVTKKRSESNYSNVDIDESIIDKALYVLEKFIHPDEEDQYFYKRGYSNCILSLSRDLSKQFICKICNRCHDKDNPYLLIFSTNNIEYRVYYKCHRDAQKRSICIGNIK